MATNTLLQTLNTDADLGGVSAADSSNRSQSETFLAGAAITKGHLVGADYSQTGADKVLYVKQTAGVATVGSKNVIGVALESVAAGEHVKVCIAGYCPYVYVDGATAEGSALIGPIGTAGQAAIEAPGTTTGHVIGVALGADTANFAAAMIYKQF